MMVKINYIAKVWIQFYTINPFKKIIKNSTLSIIIIIYKSCPHSSKEIDLIQNSSKNHSSEHYNGKLHYNGKC